MTTQKAACIILSDVLCSYAKRDEAPGAAYSHLCRAITMLSELADGYVPANDEEREAMYEAREHYDIETGRKEV